MVQQLEELKPETQATIASKSSPPKMTYEEFLEWADDKIHAEWVNGEVIFMGTVSGEHSELGRFLLALFSIWIESKSLGVIRYDPFQMKTAVHLSGRSPDILFLKSENLPRMKKNHLEGPADLVIEIICPESRARDRGEKFYEYEEGGVPEYWLLDPIRKQAEFYHRNENGIYQPMPVDENGIFRSRKLEGLWLKVEWLWQEPLPTIFNIIKAWGLIS